MDFAAYYQRREWVAVRVKQNLLLSLDQRLESDKLLETRPSRGHLRALIVRIGTEPRFITYLNSENRSLVRRSSNTIT